MTHSYRQSLSNPMSPVSPSFPTPAYLPSHPSHRQSKQASHLSHTRQSSRQDSQSSELSKGSEKGRESVDLGRPLSDPTIQAPPRIIVNHNSSRHSTQSKDFVISPFSTSSPASPRSGHGTNVMGGLSGNHFDNEKLVFPSSPASRRSRLDSVTSILEDGRCWCRRNETEDALLEQKALNILIHLSFPNIIVSGLLLIWALVAILSAIILSPFRFCTKGSLGIADSLTSFLISPLRLQHALIYSSRLSHKPTCRHSSPHQPQHSSKSTPQSSTNSSPSPSSYNPTEYKLGSLIAVHLFSPLLSLGVAFAAWTAAVFWFYAAIIGDPSGNDKPMGYNDGKSSVLAVRAWWVHWLMRPIRKG